MPTFQFLTRTWCVSRALELIAADPNAAQFVERAEIDGLDHYLALAPDEPHTMRLLVIEVDRYYAATTDLTKPIIVVHVLDDSGRDRGLMVIDGRHRVYRARSEGRTLLAAYILSLDSERAARIPIR